MLLLFDDGHSLRGDDAWTTRLKQLKLLGLIARHWEVRISIILLVILLGTSVPIIPEWTRSGLKRLSEIAVLSIIILIIILGLLLI